MNHGLHRWIVPVSLLALGKASKFATEPTRVLDDTTHGARSLWKLPWLRAILIKSARLRVTVQHCRQRRCLPDTNREGAMITSMFRRVARAAVILAFTHCAISAEPIRFALIEPLSGPFANI